MFSTVIAGREFSVTETLPLVSNSEFLCKASRLWGVSESPNMVCAQPRVRSAGEAKQIITGQCQLPPPLRPRPGLFTS